MNQFAFFLSFIIFSGCYDVPVKPNDNVGMRPTYVQLGEDISQEAMLFNDLTSIVTYQELVLAIEENIGIHIIDNADPTDPKNILFVPVFGIDNIVIKEDIIIANAGASLFSIDIADRTKAIFKSLSFIEEEVNNNGNNLYPAGYNGLFECVNPEKGLIVNWELVEMEETACWR